MVRGNKEDSSLHETAKRAQHSASALLARRDRRLAALLKFLMVLWPFGVLAAVVAFFFDDKTPIMGYLVVGALIAFEALYVWCYRLTQIRRHELARRLLFSCWTIFACAQLQLFSPQLENSMFGALLLCIANIFYAVIIIGIASLDVWERARRWLQLILLSYVVSSAVLFWRSFDAMASPRLLVITSIVCLILILCVLAFTRAFITDLQELLSFSEEARKREAMLRLQTESARDSAMQASLIKSQFLANMSHELRTPLSAIIGYVDLIEEEAEEIALHDFDSDLGRIRSAATHLHGLINDILDLSKIEAGKLEIVETQIMLPELLEGIRATVGPLMSKNDNQFVFEDTARVGRILCDDVRLRQILLNLLSNAAKFTRDGQVALRVSCQECDRLLCLEVEDSGIGISADKLDKIFAPFEQADGSTTREYGGTGLGLPITSRLVEMMHGMLEVESVPDKGSTFRVLLPLRTINDASGEAPAH